MALHVCHIVPAYILSDIVAGEDEEARRLAEDTLASMDHLHESRKSFFESELAHPEDENFSSHDIVPDYVLEDIANADDVQHEAQQFAIQTLAANQQIRDSRVANGQSAVKNVSPPTTFIQSIYDMQSRVEKSATSPTIDITHHFLPGKLVFAEGHAAVADKAVNQVHDNCLKVLQFFKKFFNYNSVNNQNMPVVSSVHFRQNYQNAAWYGIDASVNPRKVLNQMVYGDGGKDLVNFTNCIDVIGHEITHGITQFNSALRYQNESGALNEHISDVFGVMIKQWVENKKAAEADWLVGEACFMPNKKGTALRNMKNPGTAYDQMPTLGGKDPQPAHYSGIATFKADPKNQARLQRDHGGCHLFSGVPNRAFVLSAIAFEGYSWEKAGQIWWTTATTHRIAPNCTFLQFADVTVTVAEEKFDVAAAKIVRTAWDQVGVVKKI